MLASIITMAFVSAPFISCAGTENSTEPVEEVIEMPDEDPVLPNWFIETTDDLYNL